MRIADFVSFLTHHSNCYHTTDISPVPVTTFVNHLGVECFTGFPNNLEASQESAETLVLYPS